MDDLAATTLPCSTVVRASTRWKRDRQRRAFSLIELLVVMAIIAVMAAMGTVAVSGIKGGQDVAKAAYDLRGALEQARTYAMAHNTYVWVGFFEEDQTKAAGQAGTGRVVVSAVASKDGTMLYSDTGASLTALNGASLVPVSKLLRLDFTHLDVLGSGDLTRPGLAAGNPDNYQVASPAFAQRDGAPNPVTFTYPLSGAPTYTFNKIIQFSPAGDATRIVDSPTRLMEIGLRPAHGAAVVAASKNLVAIQVSGIGGQVKVYRP